VTGSVLVLGAFPGGLIHDLDSLDGGSGHRSSLLESLVCQRGLYGRICGDWAIAAY
jgi:hypothetical protein